MGHGHRGVAVEQHLGHGEAYYIAAPDHYGTLTLDVDSGFVEHTDHTFGSAGIHAGALLPKCGHVGRVETVDVLFVRDGFNHAVFVDVGRQRQLHEYAVDRIVGVELRYELQQLLLRGLLRQAHRGALIAYLLGVAPF